MPPGNAAPLGRRAEEARPSLFQPPSLPHPPIAGPAGLPQSPVRGLGALPLRHPRARGPSESSGAWKRWQEEEEEERWCCQRQDRRGTAVAATDG